VSLSFNRAGSVLYGRLIWRRLLDFCPEASLFHASGRAALPDDVEQGDLGDCYYLSALSSLAEDAVAVRNLFPLSPAGGHGPRRSSLPAPAAAKGLSAERCAQAGVHVVRLCLGGHWRAVAVDDSVPCAPLDAGGMPAFSRAKAGELWPLLCEKAWAKTHGSYQAISDGLAGEALTCLTGADCDWAPADDSRPEALFERAAAALARDWFVVAVLPSGHSDSHLDGTGLVAGHAYSILEAVQLPLAAGPARLLKLRNPWGNEDYFGRFGREEGSARGPDGEYPLGPGWTAEARAAMQARDLALSFTDGCFWMDARSFAAAFAGIIICRDTPGARHASEEARLAPRATAALLLTLGGKARAAVDVSVRQGDARRYAAVPGFAYLGTRAYLARADDLQVVASMQLCRQRDAWLEAELEPGRYWLLVQSDWDGSERPDADADAAGMPGVRVGVVARAACDGELSLLAMATEALPPGGTEALLRAALAASAARAAEADTLFFDSLFDHPQAAVLQVARISKRRFACDGGHTVAWLYRNASKRLALSETLPFCLENVRVQMWRLAGGAAEESAESAAEEAVTTVSLRLEPGETLLLLLQQEKAGAFRWELLASEDGGATAELEEVAGETPAGI